MSFLIKVCRTDELRVGDIKVVSLGTDEQGLPFQAMVLRDQSGAIRAYRNFCRHLPVPLDGGSRRFLTDDRAHLVCRTHGATYRLQDGYCIEGPCKGMSLFALEWEDRAGDLYVKRAD